MKITPSFPYRLALAGFLGLFALLMLWNTVFTSTSRFPVAFLLILTITPLLLPMRGFLDGRLKSSAWLAYISLIYFVHGCLEAYSSPLSRPFALLEILLSLMIFFGATFYIRLSGTRS
jgi:uncharacterized membrane protein